MISATSTNPYSALSSPSSGDFLGLEDVLCSRLPAKFLSRFDTAALPPQIVAALDRIAEGDLASSLFRSEFGTVGLAVTKLWKSRPSIEWLLGQFQIASFVSGAAEDIDIEFAAPWPVCISGRLLRSSRFVVRGAGDAMQILGDDGHVRLDLQRAPVPGVPLWRAATDHRVIGAGSLSALTRSYGAWADEWGSPDPEPRPDQDAMFPGQVEAAFDLFEDYAPEYYLWTATLLREVVAKGRPEGRVTTSCSYLHNFGVVEACAPAGLLETAEMLVHECSHQHYHLASWWTQMVRDGAPEVYSILKFTSRPLERLLLGFHAFGNALLMYDQLRCNRAPVPDWQLQERIQYVRSLVDALYRPLIEHKSWLSVSGYSIYQPLCDRLIAKGLIETEKAMLASPLSQVDIEAD